MKHLKTATEQHLYFVELKPDEIPNTAPVHLDMSGYDAKVGKKTETVLTISEFCSRLTAIRERLKSQKNN